MNAPLSGTDPSGYFIAGLGTAVCTLVGKTVSGIQKSFTKVYNVAAGIIGGTVCVQVSRFLDDFNNSLIHNKKMRQAGRLIAILADMSGCSGYCSAAYSAYLTTISGGSSLDIAMNAYLGYLQGVSFSNAGIDVASLTDVTRFAGKKYMNYKAREEVNRFAMKNLGISGAELNLILTAASFAGNEIAGTRLGKDSEGNNWIFGVLSRDRSSPTGKLGKYGHAIAGFPFDIIDIVLGTQGYLTATGYEVSTLKLNHIYVHSLGSIDAVNLVDYGVLDSATVYALPVGNIAPANVEVNIGEFDIFNGFFLGKLLNWNANIVKINEGVWKHQYICYLKGRNECV